MSVSFADWVKNGWLVAHKSSQREVANLLGIVAIEHGALKVQLHHDAKRLGQAGVQSDSEIQAADFSVLDEPGE